VTSAEFHSIFEANKDAAYDFAWRIAKRAGHQGDARERREERGERETIVLDLFVHPSTGQKITDYLTIRARRRFTSPDRRAISLSKMQRSRLAQRSSLLMVNRRPRIQALSRARLSGAKFAEPK